MLSKFSINMKKTILFLLLCQTIHGFTDAVFEEKGSGLEHCLMKCWGVDQHTAVFIQNKLKTVDQELLDAFIEKSQNLNIDFSPSKQLVPLIPEDGVIQATKQHLIVFESPYVRILWGSTLPGEREPFHKHGWKSLMLIVQATTFKIEYPDGTIEVGDWPVGLYELPANETYSCTNIGTLPDQILRFEIKD